MAPTRFRRPFAALTFLALLALVGGAAGSSSGAQGVTTLSPLLARSIDAQATTELQSTRLARAAVVWRGGPITASTGEVVRVFVSESLPEEVATPEAWGEFLAGLTHGPELAALTTYVATLDEAQEVCGGRALGCYSRNQMVSFGEPVIDGTTAEEVVRHEYGHHVAFHRSNAPWVAIDWGPKQWASAANVCARVQRKEAFPGDEGQNYAQNPGEAWAEAYRLMDERKAGITTATWRIIAPSFYPGEAALQAAERDVTQPWTRAGAVSFRQVFGRTSKKVWWIRLGTPLDGELRLTATLPRGGTHEVALLTANRRTVIRRGQWVGQRSKRLTTTVCGQRNLLVRVTQSGAFGPVAISASIP